MYVSLFVVGLLCILASQAIKPRGDGDNLAELALLIADAQSIRAESQSLLEQLETLGEGDPGLLGQLLDYKVRFESVDQRITALASQHQTVVSKNRQSCRLKHERRSWLRSCGRRLPRPSRLFARPSPMPLCRASSVSSPFPTHRYRRRS